MTLIERDPQLKQKLDGSCAFLPSRGKVWLEAELKEEQRPEPLVVLINPKAKPGSTSLVQYDEDGNVVGGYTLQVSAPPLKG
jgi:hypothetical protein